MKHGLAAAALIFLAPAFGLADVTRMHECERADIIRIVELQSDGQAGLPCRVFYKKPMEDQSATSLWNAKSDPKYCAEKYDAFIAKMEKVHNWSCIAKLPDSAPAESQTQTTEPEIPTLPTASIFNDLSTVRSAPKGSEIKDSVTTNDSNVNLSSSAEPAEPLIITPKLSSAFPLTESRDAAKKDLSMKVIRQLIPSGKYIVDGKVPHSGNIALCPIDGFYIWNTKRPGKPVFEMGPGESFHFDLTDLTSEPIRASVNSAPHTQCHEEVAASYCSDGVYIGPNSLHPQLSRYFNCGPSAVATANGRALVLFRSGVNQVAASNACRTTPSPIHLALATAAPSPPTDANNSVTGIELVILPNRSKSTAINDQNGAFCHYIRN